MQFSENVSLTNYSTMRLGGTARYVCEITSEDDIFEALAFAEQRMIPYRVIGSGSNIVWRDEGFSGLLIINKIESFELLQDGACIRIGAGTPWDSAVQKAVDIGLSGIEFLSLIPGTAGATPIQNVGAYGCEIKDTLISLQAFDALQKTFVTLQNEDCAFGYRTSRFKTTDQGRFIITYITLKLTNELPEPPFYEALETYLNDQRITEFTPQSIRDAVIAIRSSKLPDPAEVANNGSFFANPVISVGEFERLQKDFPDIKGWPVGDGVKVAAGWLLENAGFKNHHDEATGMATWTHQSLVLVNEHAKSTADLLRFKQLIVDTIHANYGITLEQEPELLP